MAAIDHLKGEKKAAFSLNLLLGKWLGFLGLFLVLFTVISVITTFAITPKNHLKNTFVYYLSSILVSVKSNKNKKLKAFLETGEIISFPVDRYKTHLVLNKSKKQFLNKLYWIAFISVIASLGLTILVFYYLGRAKTGSQFIRGGEIVDNAKLALVMENLIQEEKERNVYPKPAGHKHLSFGSVPIPYLIERTHISIMGDTGCGKSQQLMNIIDIAILK